MRWLCSIGTMRCQSSTTTTRTTSRSSSSSSSSGGVKNAARKRRNELFDGERERQRREIGRIEKIEVKYLSATEEVTMVMNKDLSTPHDCAKHISEGVASVAALALLDNNRLWDMTRPLPESCSLQLLSMRTPERHAVNAAFWRTCSFLLGAVIDTAFKDEHSVRLHSFTWPNIKAGSFVHDAAIDMPFDWRPTDAELRALSAAFVRLASRGLLLERLQVSQHLAMDMFQENRHKLAQIPDIANNNNNNNGGAGLVTLYRAGDHVDISKGPMIGNTGIIGRCTVTALHKIRSDGDEELYRFQGLAVPQGTMLNHFAYSILEERAKRLNYTTWVPVKLMDEMNDPVALAAKN